MRPAPRLAALLLGSVCLATTACSSGLPAEPADRPSRPLTIMTGEHFTEYDPAYAADDGSRALMHNVFQRLMSTVPGTTALRPDAADKCVYETPTIYECKLRPGQRFSNGKQVTSADVAYSIERARDINAPGTSAWMLDSIERIETPKPDRLRFHMRYSDSNIGYALASSAASIVDKDVYPKDKPFSSSELSVSSGPFWVEVAGPDEVVLRRQAVYKGANAAVSDTVILRTVRDPELKKRFVETRSIDIAWRSLPGDKQPKVLDGTPYEALKFEDAKNVQLIWNAQSSHFLNDGVRHFVRDATASIRTADSVVPPTVGDHRATFETKGKKPDALQPEVTLRLGYDSLIAGQQEYAEQVKSALEAAGGMKVELTTDQATSDVNLIERYPDTNTSLAWLDPWLTHPLPGRERRNEELQNAYRSAPSAIEGAKVAEQMQKLAAEEGTVVPLFHGDQTVWVTKGLYLDPRNKNHFGPNFQLSAWGWLWKQQ